MRLNAAIATTVLAAVCGAAAAADVNIQVILPGDLRPGLYGRVDFGSAPPPPLVYTEPILVKKVKAPPPPLYLHVPPGHAKNWSKHCARYDACGQPVYFVKSAEYDPPKKAKKPKKPKKPKQD
ncbi:MAG TPA: hypothetical protein VM073_05665 [Usitatibacter sp.]|nr:hypothetical protein [Usitatibacter sp.]